MNVLANSPAVLIGLGLSLLVSGCGGDHDISLELSFGGQDRTEVARYVVAVYRSDDCDFVYEGFPFPLYNIDTNEGARVHIQGFAGGEGEPIGELEEGTYAFVGVALDDICLQEYVGCTTATVGEVSEVVVDMAEADAPMPYCGTVTTGCIDGRCTDM